MAKKKDNELHARWIIVLTIAVTLLAFFGLLNNSVIKKNKSETSRLTKEQAVAKVQTQFEVKDFLNRVSQAKVEVGGEENDSYLIQVFEVKNGHTATFNWYRVNKTTGEVKKEF